MSKNFKAAFNNETGSAHFDELRQRIARLASESGMDRIIRKSKKKV
jgi:hypothetical protein